MHDPFVIDVSHITALSCLAPEAAKSISWLHDGHPPTFNGSEYLVFFITLWYACSLLQPDFDFFFDSEFRRSRAPGFTTATLAAAWLSHSMHVPVPTSPQAGGDRLQVWLCDNVVFLSDVAPCLTSHVGYGVQNTGGGGGGGGGGGDSSEHIFACQLRALDTCYYHDGPSDIRIPPARGRGCWRVGYDVDNGSTTLVTVRIPSADCAPMTDSALLEGSWQGHCALPPGPGMTSSDLDDLDSPSSSESQGQAGRSSTSVMLEESHEARGVGLIVKALVQQNAGSSLFLRTMVCVAALLCFTHAIIVLGERPSLFVGCRTS